MDMTTLLIALCVALAAAAAAAAVMASRFRNDAAEATRTVEKLRARYRGIDDANAAAASIVAEAEVLRAQARADFAKQQAEFSSACERERADIAAIRKASDAAIAAERQGVADERTRANADLAALRTEREQLEVEFARLRAEIAPLDEAYNLLTFAFYTPRYDFATSEAYAARLDDVRNQQRTMLTEKRAAISEVEFTVNGSKTEGRKQLNQTIKLMLRAFNGECDAAVAKVRYNNVQVMETRIRKAWEIVNSLAVVQRCRIVPEYLELKLKELFLAHEYQEKLQAEREEQRRIREQMREEELAQRELERARLEAEKEETRYEAALVKARADAERAVGAQQERLQAQIAELEHRLSEAHLRKERAIAQAQLTRSGHVYIISNVGSFGDNVFKIGMTRRLEPLERIKELGDASVPFEFDVHAVIYSDDAPSLENKLHQHFHWRRLNRINERKEFFRVTIDEIAAVVRQERAEIEIIKDAEAKDFRQTLALLEEEIARGQPAPEALAQWSARFGRRFGQSPSDLSLTPLAASPMIAPARPTSGVTPSN